MYGFAQPRGETAITVGKQDQSARGMRVLRSIRSRLLALVVATVVPFTALIGVGLWSQWQSDQASAIAQAINEARMLASQIDDHIGNLENLMTGLSEAVSRDPSDRDANDA